MAYVRQQLVNGWQLIIYSYFDLNKFCVEKENGVLNNK